MSHLVIPESVRILSIDPGTTVTGHALSIFHCRTGQLSVLRYGKIQPINLAKKDKSNSEIYTQQLMALSYLRDEMTNVIKSYKPDFIVTEDAFLHPQRVKAYAALSMCISTIAMVAKDTFQLPIYKLAPCLIKKIAAGHGQADKLAIQEAIITHENVVVKETKSQPYKTMSEHEADAIAVAIAFRPMLPTLIRQLIEKPLIDQISAELAVSCSNRAPRKRNVKTG